MSDTIIKVEGLYKKFCTSLKRSMLYGTLDAFKDMSGISTNTLLRKREFWALQDINFEINKGEKVGFLGINGSGKTTLLRLLNGIFPPDEGKITIKGRIGALLAVGAGFHPYMTGRENIYLNATILGMSKNEITRRFDEIVDFAEIGDFLDAPVATYSSGMVVRLGFSIAVHGNVDIMLVDEILSVGDLAYQLKCLKKLSEFRVQGGTFIIVSHNMQVIRNSCKRAFWIENGILKKDGEVFTICDQYETAQLSHNYGNEYQGIDNLIIKNDRDVSIVKVEFLNNNNQVSNQFAIGNIFKAKVYFNLMREVAEPIFSIAMVDSSDNIVFESYTHEIASKLSGAGSLLFEIETLNIKPGIYSCSVTLSEKEHLNKLEWHEKAYHIFIINEGLPINQGYIYPFPKWFLKS